MSGLSQLARLARLYLDAYDGEVLKLHNAVEPGRLLSSFSGSVVDQGDIQPRFPGCSMKRRRWCTVFLTIRAQERLNPNIAFINLASGHK